MDFQMKDGRIVTVRQFREDDFEDLVAMFQGLSKEALRYGLPPYDRARLERWVSGLDGGIILLALDRERVVGVAAVFGPWNPRMKGVG
jgi:hypothetical protein